MSTFNPLRIYFFESHTFIWYYTVLIIDITTEGRYLLFPPMQTAICHPVHPIPDSHSSMMTVLDYSPNIKYKLLQIYS